MTKKIYIIDSFPCKNWDSYRDICKTGCSFHGIAKKDWCKFEVHADIDFGEVPQNKCRGYK